MGTSAFREAVAAEVRAEIARQNLTITDVADRAGLARSTLHRKLRGGGAFNVDEIRWIADALDVSLTQLMPALDKAVA